MELETPKKGGSEIRALREQIPSEMLNRFDKFLGRGKKGVALVQNGVCKGCQIQVPVGVVNALIQGIGASVCGNCGRYLCLLEADAIAFQNGSRPGTITVSKSKIPTLRTKSIRPSRKSSTSVI